MRRADDMFSKTIHGEEVTQETFRRTICDTLELLDGGRTADLIEALGPEWNSAEHKRILSKTIDNLVTTGLVHRVERGVYKVTPSYRRRGVSVTSITEKAIIEMMRDAGGFMLRSEILEGFNLSYRSDDARTRNMEMAPRVNRVRGLTAHIRDMSDPRKASITRHIDKVLAESPQIRTDCLSAGFYNLRPEEVNALPLRGLFAGLLIRALVHDATGEAAYMERRDAFFSSVGAAFYEARRLRGYRTAAAFLQHKRVMSEVVKLAELPAIRQESHNWFVAETQARVDAMIERGATPKEIADFRTDREESRDGIQHYVDILERFEAGGDEKVGVNLHLHAPVSFYRVLAEVLEMDAASLSRGLLFNEMISEQSRPQQGMGYLKAPTSTKP